MDAEIPEIDPKERKIGSAQQGKASPSSFAAKKENVPKVPDGWVEINWVHFIRELRIAPGHPLVAALASGALKVGQTMKGPANLTKLYVGMFAGFPCVFIEDKRYTLPAKIPMTSVASFG